MRIILATLLLAACSDKLTDQKPVGGTVDSEAAIQRYLRRAYLDLSGHVPADADLTASTQQLEAANNSATARGTLVDSLIASPDYPKLWIGELENAIFGGNDLQQQYAFVCGVIRGSQPDCQSCTAQDSCTCSCSILPALLAERTQLAANPTDFAGTVKSSTIEKRYAMAQGYFILAGTAESRTKTLFSDFLARPAEADEIENGRAMIFGSITGAPCGLLFHEEGKSYSDMIDIIWRSEVYREAIVRRVFERYLAREPSSAELAHFVTTLDANEPDLRGVVRAVVSSREYFDQ